MRGKDLAGSALIKGKYRLLHAIGSGGFGTVFAAEQLVLKRRVAIKLCERYVNAAAGLREARLAATLCSESSVQIYDVDVTEDGVLFIVMELLSGEDLRSLLRRRGSLPVAQVLDLGRQLCEAVTEAHSRGLIHGDLKPSNLFVTQRSSGALRVKLLDFGLARSVVATEENGDASIPALHGTPGYMAPECVTGELPCQQSDQWAIGVVLFEMLTGTKPFSGSSQSGLFASTICVAAPLVSDCAAGIPFALEEIVGRCLRKHPAERFPNVRALRDALSECARQASSQESRGFAGDDTESVSLLCAAAPKQRHFRRRAGGAAAVVSGALLVAATSPSMLPTSFWQAPRSVPRPESSVPLGAAIPATISSALAESASAVDGAIGGLDVSDDSLSGPDVGSTLGPSVVQRSQTRTRPSQRAKLPPAATSSLPSGTATKLFLEPDF